MKRLASLVLITLAFSLPLATARSASAQVIAEAPPPPFPDPKRFARGFFASGELGAFVFLGRAAKYAPAGPTFGVRLGYDLTRWLALQAHVSGTSADANLPPPTVGQSFQLLLYAAEVRAQVQIRRVALSLEGGAGAAQITSNVLELVNVTKGAFSLAVLGGVGLDYHTLNRHFSVGLDVDYLWLKDWRSSHGITATAYLRYTH
jgi:hypothetical protein